MMKDPKKYQDWNVIFTSGTDYEADLVRDRLDDAGIEAIVLTQRDHAFNLNIGDLSSVSVLVPPSRVAEAERLLASEPFTDEELNQAAMSADIGAPDAHDRRREAALDSGIEEINFSFPEEEEDEDLPGEEP